MATCIDVAGANYPIVYSGNELVPYEGISLSSTFDSNKVEERPLFWEHEGNKAVRLGKYKLVSKWEKNSEYNWELYNLEADRTEMNNIISEHPKKAQELEQMWKA